MRVRTEETSVENPYLPPDEGGGYVRVDDAPDAASRSAYIVYYDDKYGQPRSKVFRRASAANAFVQKAINDGRAPSPAYKCRLTVTDEATALSEHIIRRGPRDTF